LQQRISNQSLSPRSVCQRELLYLQLKITVPSALGVVLVVLNAITPIKTVISRSNGRANCSSNTNNRSHKNHAEMQLLNKGKLEGEIILDSNSATTQPCYHCLRSLLQHIQKNPHSKFTLIYKLNGEYVKIKSTQLHTLLNTSIVSSGMRSHKRRA
jgi:hypothetical protein